MASGEMGRLERALERRFRVVETNFDVAGHALSILHPASAEELISEADFEKDERLPYWAELWPSARVLAEHVAGMTGGQRPLLELGCGSGIVTSVAALAGFDVTASDYYEDAVKFAALNAWRNARVVVQTMVLDWRALPPEPPRFDVILASDVLYERPYGAVVARVLSAMLTADGVAIVADPGRVGREPFLAALADHGLMVLSADDLGYTEGAIKQTISLFTIGMIASKPI